MMSNDPVKLAFHGADTDILATILARMSVSVSMSASWNASFRCSNFVGRFVVWWICYSCSRIDRKLALARMLQMDLY